MLKKQILICLVGTLLSVSVVGEADIIQLMSPSEFIYSATTLSFDDGPSGAAANTRYLDKGVEFSRDDGYDIFLYDVQSLGDVTTSPPNVIATVAKFPAITTWAMHLNAIFSSPIYELGAFFGNDQGYGYTATTLSIFDIDGVLLDSVVVPTNNNTNVDQFIGLRSDVAFYFARFENNGEWLAVNLDDMVFTVPEPATVFLLGLGGLAIIRKSSLKHKTKSIKP
ncbi:MAG: PEP-CTERM sorting domain-containing protein [Phycisphaerae bacterium]|nr:PEP-CTERM sorting domain-containing protein [Phycisphaerae bacterium]MDD5381237.1 PEP-CTERM sorting domain-containing protein [Phycisphaerae bacterium]